MVLMSHRAVVLFCAAAIGSAQSKLPAPEREFEVLVVPGAEVRRPLPPVRAELVKATLDDQKLRVVAVEGRGRVEKTPLLVILDTGWSEDAAHGCLTARMLRELGEIQREALDVTVYVGGGAYCSLVTAVQLSEDLSFGMVKATPEELGRLGSQCQDTKAWGRFETLAGPVTGMTYLLQRYREDGSLPRVVWVSDRFAWFDMRESSGGRIPNPLFGEVEQVSRVGFTLFPLSAADLEKSEREAAEYAAGFLGGRVIAVPPGGKGLLRSAIAELGEAYVMRLAGRPSRRRKGNLPRELKIRSESADARFEWTRPFVLDDPELRPIEDAVTNVPFLRLATADSEVGIRRVDSQTAEIVVPERVKKRLTGTTRVVFVSQNPNGTHDYQVAHFPPGPFLFDVKSVAQEGELQVLLMTDAKDDAVSGRGRVEKSGNK